MGKATAAESIAFLKETGEFFSDSKKEIKTTPEPIQVDWFDDHFYLVQQEPEPLFIPSVTSKLSASPKPFLSRWRGDVGNREADLRMNDAAHKGSRIHNAWFVYNTGGWVIFNPYERPNYSNEDIQEMKLSCNGLAILTAQEEMYAVHKLQKWVEAVSPKFIESEKIVYSLTTLNAGTMDNLLFIEQGEYNVNGSEPIRLDKGYYVFDLKSGNAIDEDDAPAQVAIYAQMYSEMTGIEITGTLICHTNARTKKGIEGLATLHRNKEEMKSDLEYFYDVSKVWQKKLSHSKPKYFKFPSLIKL